MMFRKILLTLVAATSIATLAAQQHTAKSITGKWTLAGVITDGELMPLDSDESLKNYMLGEALAKKKQKEGPMAVLTMADSASTSVSVKMLSAMRNSEAEFRSNGKFRFTLTLVFSQAEITTGNWQIDESTQTILVTGSQNEAGETIKITPQGSQLLMRFDETKNDGYLLSRKK